MPAPTFHKTFGRTKSRVLLEVLFIRYVKACIVDYQFSVSIGRDYGLSISLLSPNVLLEVAILPLKENTQDFYMSHE